MRQYRRKAGIRVAGAFPACGPDKTGDTNPCGRFENPLSWSTTGLVRTLLRLRCAPSVPLNQQFLHQHIQIWS